MDSFRPFSRRTAPAGLSPPPSLRRHVGHLQQQQQHSGDFRISNPNPISIHVPSIDSFRPVPPSNPVRRRNKSRSRSTSSPFLIKNSNCCQISEQSYSSIRNIGLHFNTTSDKGAMGYFRTENETGSKAVKAAVLFGCIVLAFCASK